MEALYNGYRKADAVKPLLKVLVVVQLLDESCLCILLISRTR